VRRALAIALVASTALIGATPAWSQYRYTPNITVDLSGTVVTDESVADDDLLGTVGLEDLGTLPPSTEVDAYEPVGSEHLFSLDTTVLLPGSLTATPADVIRYNGSTYSLEFDASAEGLPGAANVDAVSTSGSDLVLSFDTTIDLGSGLVADDEDLVAFNGVSFLLIFDGSAAGLDPSLDLDAAGATSGGDLLVSFDHGGSIGGHNFDDDTVLAFTGASWSIAFDASDEHAGFGGGDLIAVAVPEPNGLLGLLSGSALLFVLTRHRAGGSHSSDRGTL